MTWSDYEHALERARDELRERFPNAHPAILMTFDIAWSGWEGDSRGALITLDGVPMLIAIDQTIEEGRFTAEVAARLAEYRRLISETEAALERYRQLGGTVEQSSDWTPEDDRLVLVGQIADVIETMPIADLERVLVLAKLIHDE